MPNFLPNHSKCVENIEATDALFELKKLIIVNNKSFERSDGLVVSKFNCGIFVIHGRISLRNTILLSVRPG